MYYKYTSSHDARGSFAWGALSAHQSSSLLRRGAQMSAAYGQVGGTAALPHRIGSAPEERLEDVDAVEVLGGLAQALGHELLAVAQRHARVVVLLVGLLVAVGVADLALEVGAELRLI